MSQPKTSQAKFGGVARGSEKPVVEAATQRFENVDERRMRTGWRRRQSLDRADHNLRSEIFDFPERADGKGRDCRKMKSSEQRQIENNGCSAGDFFATWNKKRGSRGEAVGKGERVNLTRDTARHGKKRASGVRHGHGVKRRRGEIPRFAKINPRTLGRTERSESSDRWAGKDLENGHRTSQSQRPSGTQLAASPRWG